MSSLKNHAPSAQQPARSPAKEPQPTSVGASQSMAVDHVAVPPDPRADLLGLQQVAGNEAVSQSISQLLQAESTLAPTGGALIQRQCAACAASAAAGGGKCAKCQEEEQTLQRKVTGGAPALAAHIPASVQTALQASGGQPLDGKTRAFMETRFGQNLDHVRVHTDANAVQAAADLDANAFTVGNAIWFGNRQYQPEAPAGLHLLAHELAHTIQQRGQTPGVQTALRIGATNDPLETMADRAADAVLGQGQLPGLGASTPVIRRKPKVSPVAGKPEERYVALDNGDRYRVVRDVTWVDKKETYRTDVGPKIGLDADSKNFWLQVDWCRTDGKGDRKGEVKLGADVPAQAIEFLKNAGDAIRRGEDPRTALSKVNLTPFISVVVAQSKRYSVDVKATTTVDPIAGQVKKGGVEATIKLPQGEISGNVQITAPQGGQSTPGVEAGVGFKTTFGGPKKVECPVRERVIARPQVTYTCYKETPEHPETRTRPVMDTPTSYLYFKYMNDQFEDNVKAPGGARNPEEQRQLEERLQKGYQVTAISGFASPEGPQKPAPNFIGNNALSEQRAKAAKTWIENKCKPATPSLLQMRQPQKLDCFAANVQSSGGGELYTKTKQVKGKEREVEGRELAEHAVGEFQKNPDEEGRLTDEERETLKKREGSPEKQAELVYPLLRRAEISLQKEIQQEYQVTVPASSVKLDSCPREVLEAADEDFQPVAPVVKPQK